jgi:hypothetical protein
MYVCVCTCGELQQFLQVFLGELLYDLPEPQDLQRLVASVPTEGGYITHTYSRNQSYKQTNRQKNKYKYMYTYVRV